MHNSYSFGDLYRALVSHQESGAYSFHMPGHKQVVQDFEIRDEFTAIRGFDITEIEGFDDLHDAKGLIKGLQDSIADFYNVEHSCILVNGSTAGVLSAISACCERDDLLIMARNSHKSAYNAVMINGLKTEFVYPRLQKETGICSGINPSDIEIAIERNPQAKAVYITSPTYEGVISDVESIARIAHEHNLPLIVDEAHGAHLGIYDSKYRKDNGMISAVAYADIVIQSLHKTLPSFTQTGVLHYKCGLINESRLKKYLSVYQSSSPSYIFMAGIDRCFEILANNGSRLFKAYEQRLKNFLERAERLKNLKILTGEEILKWPDAAGFDACKLVVAVSCRDCTGKELSERLMTDYNIFPEMSSLSYIILMTSIYDTTEGFEKLIKALEEIDITLKNRLETEGFYDYPQARIARSISEAVGQTSDAADTYYEKDQISRNFIYAYPPGIPLITPGEIFSEEILELREEYLKKGFSLRVE